MFAKADLAQFVLRVPYSRDNEIVAVISAEKRKK
jgi:hypothetical protein